MGRNLTNLPISASFQYLMQVSGSENDVNDGLGNDIDTLNVDITGNAATATSASYATTASFAENVTTPTLQQVTDEGATTTNAISGPRINLGGSGTNGVVNVYDTSDNEIFRATATGVQIGGLSQNYDLAQYGNTTQNGNVNVTGAVTASAGFKGDLEGNADTATSASAVLINETGADISYRMAFVQDAGAGGKYDVVYHDEDGAFDYNPSTNTMGVRNIAATSITSSFQGDLDGNAETASSASLVNTEYDASRTGIHYLTFVDARTSDGQQLFTDAELQYDPSTDTIEANLTGTASIASDLVSTADININSITASNASFASASIGYLQSITGSAKIIGDAFIVLNNDTPTERYAGLVVQDSGSTANTASLLFDGQTNDWFYQYTDDGGATDEFGVVMFGPGYNTQGAHVYPSNNTILKGTGDHHIVDSSITDDGTLVTINANVSASGYISASTYYGDGSNLSGIVTTPFPYTGSAQITGSLEVTGSIKSIGGVAIGSETFPTSLTTNGNVVIGGNGNGNSNNGPRITAGTAGIVLGGYNTTISSTGNWNSILGGSGNSISAGNANTVVGGYYSTISNGEWGSIFGAKNSSISATGAQPRVLVGGDANSITGGQDTAVIAGTGNSVSHDRSVVIGGSSLASSKTDEVVVNHLSIYGDTLVDDGVTTGQLIDNIGQTVVSVEDAVQHIVHCTQAEYDAITPDANTLYVIDGAETLGDTNVDGKLTGVVNVLSDASGTTTLDCSVGNYFTLTMPAGGSTTLTPTNITAGQTINIKITQNATASTLAYAASIDFPGGTAFTISTGAGEVDVLTLVSFDGTSLQATGLANFS